MVMGNNWSVSGGGALTAKVAIQNAIRELCRVATIVYVIGLLPFFYVPAYFSLISWLAFSIIASQGGEYNHHKLMQNTY